MVEAHPGNQTGPRRGQIAREKGESPLFFGKPSALEGPISAPGKGEGKRIGLRPLPPLPVPERGLQAPFQGSSPVQEAKRPRQNLSCEKIPIWPRENPSSRGKNPLPKRKTLHGEKIPSPRENPFKEEKTPSPRQKSFVKERKRLAQGKNLRSAASKPKKPQKPHRSRIKSQLAQRENSKGKSP
jgi:hypothetical protein